MVRKVVDDLMRRLEHNTHETLRGALIVLNVCVDVSMPTSTGPLGANLRHYQPQHRTVIPETLAEHTRHTKTRADLDHVVLCVNQSGSMASSVVYSSIFAAVMASVPGLSTKLICFDTSIGNLTDQLADPVEVLFGVQLGSGTDINSALSYCEKQIENPAKTHFVLITHLWQEDANSMLARAARSSNVA